jgi:hypothetical protein
MEVKQGNKHEDMKFSKYSLARRHRALNFACHRGDWSYGS